MTTARLVGKALPVPAPGGTNREPGVLHDAVRRESERTGRKRCTVLSSEGDVGPLASTRVGECVLGAGRGGGQEVR